MYALDNADNSGQPITASTETLQSRANAVASAAKPMIAAFTIFCDDTCLSRSMHL